MLERGPPLWPAVYPPAGSSLQHAHQLQLLSHQQLVRQQELYMIQQQAAQVMELQRNAQFVVGNKSLDEPPNHLTRVGHTVPERCLSLFGLCLLFK